MAIVNATFTVDGKEYWAKFFGKLLGDPGTTTVVGVTYNPLITHFKVGEGGWIDNGAGAVRRDPPENNLRRVDNNIQDLDSIVDGTRLAQNQRYLPTSRGNFQKALIPADFTFEAPATLRVRCLLDFADFNNDGNGNSPEIWEIGLYSDHPTVGGQKLMIAYGTFPKETKHVGVQITNIVRLSLA